MTNARSTSSLTTPAHAGGGRRLLFVVNDARFFLSHRLSLGLMARAHGYDVHVAAREDEAAAEIRAHGLRFHPIAVDRIGKALWRDGRTIWQLVVLIRRLRPDLLHCVTIKPLVYGGLVARLLRVPACVAAVSGLGQMFDRQDRSQRWVRTLIQPLYRLALAHPNGRVIFQNRDDLHECVAHGLVREERAVLIHGSGVDPGQFRPSPEPAGVPIVLLPARLLWAKGIGEFVEAARRLHAEGCRARFVIVGEPPENDPKAVPARKLEAWHDQGIVEWWGFQRDMAGIHARAGIVCLPSFYREGVPRALIEAATCGRPIVTTDMPGCREICRDGENGLLVPPRDVPALVDALRRLITDRGLRRRMGAAGRQVALAEFSLSMVLEQTLLVYESVAGADRPVGRAGQCRPGALGSVAALRNGTAVHDP